MFPSRVRVNFIIGTLVIRAVVCQHHCSSPSWIILLISHTFSYMFTDLLAAVAPVPAGPPLSSASSPWRCTVPAPCFVPAGSELRPCPPRGPLSAPHAASYTPACRTAHTHICIYILGTYPMRFTKPAIKPASVLHVTIDWKVSSKRSKGQCLYI